MSSYTSILHALCIPTVALTCTVSPAATSDKLSSDIVELSAELSHRYYGHPQWPNLYNYLTKIQSTGNPSWRDARGNSLLEYCMQELPDCDARLVHRILLIGVTPNPAERTAKLTPLHRAAQANDYRMALRLLAFGAKADSKDNKGRTPAQLTTHPQLKALLRQAKPQELTSAEALTAWKKAVNGDVAAMAEVAGYYNDDTGLHSTYMSQWCKDEQGADVDELEKIAWLEQAAAKGHSQAQFNLGLRMLYGRGMQQNESRAYTLIIAAQKQGNEDATEFLKENPIPDNISIAPSL